MELVENGKLKERSMMETGIQSISILICLKNIAPKLNTLIAVVELKRLFQGSMSLEDFHTKALCLVNEAEYPEGDTHDQIPRDTLISGIASDKIQTKIIKEGKDVTLP